MSSMQHETATMGKVRVIYNKDKKLKRTEVQAISGLTKYDQ